MKHNENIDVSGHLEIYKVYEDGVEEQVFADHNVITSGMGVGLGLLYSGSGAADITNFQIRYFKLGVKGDTVIDTYGIDQVDLVSALGQVEGISDYHTDVDSNLPIVTGYTMNYDGGAKSTSQGSYNWFFGVIPDNSIKRVDLNSVTYIMYIERGSCNSHTLNEIGLYMKNPLGYATTRSNLVAYRPFTDIAKTDDFALVFKWTLNF
tara:strand:+ start:21376 stop:21996 length:621 start_codon:yes stop_codon:yes gene_type:complete